jgi:hypothetical protein
VTLDPLFFAFICQPWRPRGPMYTYDEAICGGIITRIPDQQLSSFVFRVV